MHSNVAYSWMEDSSAIVLCHLCVVSLAALFQLLQVSIYITEGLERARDSLTEAAALRERFVLPSVSRRVAAAAASAVITLAFMSTTV